jgi:hypothetical protein
MPLSYARMGWGERGLVEKGAAGRGLDFGRSFAKSTEL